jgi:hypothetical protein
MREGRPFGSYLKGNGQFAVSDISLSHRNLARFPLLKPLASGESTEKPPNEEYLDRYRRAGGFCGVPTRVCGR